ncbi:MAG: UxaA family hydrolase [Candidatus Latescibacteria bacterium]|nr:UxaA family hydrolase [Candidatus Latescibacterota bacterium]
MENTVVALVLDDRDNVATLLSDAEKGDIVNLKGDAVTVILSESVPYGHKIAMTAIAKGEAIVKYGQKIGMATKDISPGSWVHLHNMGSAVDATFKKRIDSWKTES